MKYSHDLTAGIKAIIQKDNGLVEVQEPRLTEAGSTLKIEEYNQEGELVSITEQPFKSFTANFLRAMWARMTSGATAITGDWQNFQDGDKDSSVGRESNIKVSVATTGKEKLGLTFFSNTDTNTPETYTGTIVPGLDHKQTVVSVITSDSTTYSFTIQKTIENTSGSTKTVNKVGLIAQTNSTGEIDSDDNTLIAIDDVESGTTNFLNGHRRVLTLTIKISKDFFNQNMISLLNSVNGQEGKSFASGAGATVLAIAFHPTTGDMYIGGDFTSVAGVANTSRIAKYSFTTNSWSALGSGMDGSIIALAFDSSGNLYAGGGFNTAGGVTVNYIVKWNGSAWSALGSGVGSGVYAIAIDSSGNLYAGGNFTTAGGVSANYIAKWNGSAWSALGSGVGATVRALAIDSSGNLYAGGDFTSPASYIAKWNGSAWSALGSGMSSFVNALAFDSSGNLYAGGSFTTAGGVTVNRIAKWNGSAWSALGSGVSSSVYALAFDSSVNLYAGGSFSTAGGVTVNRIAKWNGSAWSALGSGMNNTVRALKFNSNNDLTIGGDFTDFNGVATQRIVKIAMNKFVKITGEDMLEALWNTKTSVTPDNYMSVEASSTNDTYGILVGSGTGAIDYNLQTKIAHGTGAGTLEYGACSISQPEVIGNYTEFEITRTFTNSSGAPIIINEIGLFLKGTSTSGSIMVMRKVQQITLGNGEDVTITVFVRTEI